MRPDEHKKKKNAAYKKKHGIQSKGGASGGDEGQDQRKRKDGSKVDAKGKNPLNDAQKTKVREQNYHPKTEACEDGSTSSSGEESQPSRQKKTQGKKTFRRREIVSNWRKYELEPEADEKIIPKGEDFQKLLNEAGTALSHFRFKDELEWESGLDPAVGGESEGNEAQFLSINPASLSETLSCLPMHTVLGLDPSVFPDDHLASIVQTAEGKRLSISHLTSHKPPQNPLLPFSQPDEAVLESSGSEAKSKHSQSSSKNLLSSTLSKAQLPKASPTLNASNMNRPDAQNEVERTETEGCADNRSHSEKAEADNMVKQASTCQPAKPQPVQDSSIEDDLDFLLSMESPQSINDGKPKDTKESQPSVLQSNEAVSQKVANMHQIGKETGMKKAATVPVSESADLEDWLDSVLDS